MSEFGYDVTEINEIIGSYLPDVRGFQTTVQKAMNEAVEAFVQDAEQFDDLTMLCLEYRG